MTPSFEGLKDVSIKIEPDGTETIKKLPRCKPGRSRKHAWGLVTGSINPKDDGIQCTKCGYRP